MKHIGPLLTVGIALSLSILTSCATSATSAPSAPDAAITEAASAPADATTGAVSAPAAAPQVSMGQDAITVSGSGNGETSPIAMDKPYYIVKVTNAAAADYGSVVATVKGKEMPAILTLAADYTTVFRPDSPTLSLVIEATGGYTIAFGNPPSGAAVAAPQTFKGAAGTTITPLVKSAGTYVKLTLKYLGSADADAPTGVMLATANIYDAATGEPVLNVPKYVNKAKPEDSDGITTSKPGTYFLIITGSSADDPWEASITEEWSSGVLIPDASRRGSRGVRRFSLWNSSHPTIP